MVSKTITNLSSIPFDDGWTTVISAVSPIRFVCIDNLNRTLDVYYMYSRGSGSSNGDNWYYWYALQSCGSDYKDFNIAYGSYTITVAYI